MTDKPNYGKNPNAAEPAKEKVRVIPIEYIDEFPNHPFHVNDDEEMEKLMTSIKEIGLQTPIVARIKEDGRYEIVSGHRRLYAMKKLGMTQISAIVRDMTRDEAIIAMVDSNLQREHILPSEKAAAYKMKMEALAHQGKRIDLTCAPVVHKLDGEKTRDIIGQESGDSREQVRRYIRFHRTTYFSQGFEERSGSQLYIRHDWKSYCYYSVRERNRNIHRGNDGSGPKGANLLWISIFVLQNTRSRFEFWIIR